MNTTRLWTLGSVLVIFVLVAGTWFLGISPKLTEAATANNDRHTVEAQNTAHQATIASLKEQHERLDELTAERDVLHRAVPAQANLAALIGEINSLAAGAGVTVNQLTSQDPVSFVPVEGEEADPELTASLATVTAENFLIIPIEMNLTGDYRNVMKFVNELQLGDRLVLVHGLNLAEGPAVSGQAVEYSLSGQTFVFLDASVLAADEAETSEETAAE